MLGVFVQLLLYEVFQHIGLFEGGKVNESEMRVHEYICSSK